MFNYKRRTEVMGHEGKLFMSPIYIYTTNKIVDLYSNT